MIYQHARRDRYQAIARALGALVRTSAKKRRKRRKPARMPRVTHDPGPRMARMWHGARGAVSTGNR